MAVPKTPEDLESELQPKAALRDLWTRQFGQAPGQDDIVYVIFPIENQFQATVRLDLEEDPTFAGELANNEEDAEHEAAVQAISWWTAGEPRPKAHTAPAPKEEIEVSNGEPSPKVKLIQLVERTSGQTPQPEHIRYSVEDFDGKYQAVVTVELLGGVEFAGELATTIEEAEQEAAAQALIVLGAKAATQAQGGLTPTSTRASTPRSRGPASRSSTLQAQTTAPGAVVKEASEDAEDESNPKAVLKRLWERKVGRAPGKKDITYAVIGYSTGYQATVVVTLEHDYEFAGEVASDPEEAERQAALQAVQWMGKLEDAVQQTKVLREGVPPKDKLVQLFERKAGKRLEFGNICYTTGRLGDKYQGAVKVFERTYAGLPASTVEEAEQEAAIQAIISLGY